MSPSPVSRVPILEDMISRVGSISDAESVSELVSWSFKSDAFATWGLAGSCGGGRACAQGNSWFGFPPTEPLPLPL